MSNPRLEPTEDVEVVNSWLIVDGCKVAKVPRPGVIAFHDKDRRRCSKRGNDQPCATIETIVAAVTGETEKVE
jgi:hypothetical protein